MSRLRNEKLTDAAQKLDAKLAALAEQVTGASA
jgi:cell division protein ZapA (FtsZ GTPase activity inhibitor)